VRKGEGDLEGGSECDFFFFDSAPGGVPLSSSMSLLLKNSFRMETTPWILSGIILSCARGAILQTVKFLNFRFFVESFSFF
jgi:hypothetical protein